MFICGHSQCTKCMEIFSILIIILVVDLVCNCFGMMRTDPIAYDDNPVITHLVFFCHVLSILVELSNDVLKHEKSQNPAPYNSLFYIGFIVIGPFTLLLGHILICVIRWNDKILCIMTCIVLLFTKMISYWLY